jgi:sec-independent protein translocase protein TatA
MLTNGLGWPHLLVLGLVVVLVFGSKRLPDTARSLGRSMRILKAETTSLRTDTPTHTDVEESEVDPARLAAMQRQVDELRTRLADREKA